jgi:hypothetical protein
MDHSLGSLPSILYTHRSRSLLVFLAVHATATTFFAPMTTVMITSGQEQTGENHTAISADLGGVDSDAAGMPESANTGDHREEEGDDDDDNVTVIFLDHDASQRQAGGTIAFDWIEQHGPEMEERRRALLLRELKRSQRNSFVQFLVLCLVPVAMFIVVIVSVVGEDDACQSPATVCKLEPRLFINAFTTRCSCEPIPVVRNGP